MKQQIIGYVKSHKKYLVLLAPFIFIMAVLIVIACLQLTNKAFYKGVSVEGFSLGGIKPDDAKRLMERYISTVYEQKCLSLSYNGRTWNIDLYDVAYSLNLDETIELAYRLGRNGNPVNRLYDIISLRFTGKDIKLSGDYDTALLKQIIEDIGKQIAKEPKDAAIIYKNGNILASRDVEGECLNVDENMKIIENYIKAGNFEEILLKADKIPPIVTFYDISMVNGVISDYTTAFNSGDTNRTHNIRLACEKINNMILLPGEVFSMNEVLGERTIENGYKDAPVIFKNELVSGPGGGVCQVTTTLYNAVLLAKAEIVERVRHSLPLGYVPLGQDATIAEDYIDFKFKNNSDYAICINAEIKGGSLTVRLLGKKDENGYITKLKSYTLEEYHPEPDEIVIDNLIPDGQKVVSKEARKGYRAAVYREVYLKNGELVERVKISEDIYKPVRGQIKVNSSYKAINAVLAPIYFN